MSIFVKYQKILINRINNMEILRNPSSNDEAIQKILDETNKYTVTWSIENNSQNDNN